MAATEDGGCPLGPMMVSVARRRIALDLDLHARIGDGVGSDRALDRRQGDALRVARPVGLGGQLPGGVLHGLLELGVGRHLVDQAPLDRAGALDAFLGGAEGIGQITPHLALVGDPREAARSRQHRQQRQLGQRHGGAAVIGQQDVIGRQRQLVAAAGRRAADRAHVFLPARRRSRPHGVARLVRELGRS